MKRGSHPAVYRIACSVLFVAIESGLFGQSAAGERFILRYEPGAVLSENLPEHSVPPQFLEGDSGVELVSVPASEAPAPRPVNRRRTLEQVDTADLAVRLDSDRLLLSEIRKPVPEDRDEAVLYLARLKVLAATSDPTRLVPLANRVLDQAPIYYDWLSRDFASQDEQILEYYVGGARGFSFALDNFRTAAMFSIMSRLDVASRVISELDTTW
jgi:hypothetical protein